VSWIRGGVVFAALVVFVAVAFCAGGCTSIRSYPYPSCLYDSQGRWDKGKVIAERGDGAQLFEFTDTGKGDHGFLWVTPDSTRTLRPCREKTLMDVDSPGQLEPPELPA
jgi:hypothetical protein